MTSFPSVVLAQQPLFGNQWLALAAILAGIAVFMLAVAGIGRWLAATHPEPAALPAAITAPAAGGDAPTPELLAVIAAAVAVTAGPRSRITAVVPVKPATPNLEMLMQQWSVEGRRQIYSSHQIR
jgi:hypothetical protein